MYCTEVLMQESEIQLYISSMQMIP